MYTWPTAFKVRQNNCYIVDTSGIHICKHRRSIMWYGYGLTFSFFICPSLPFPLFFGKHTQTRRGNHLCEPICIRVTECSSDGSIEFVSKYPPWIGNGLIGPIAQRGSVGRLDWNHSTWSLFHRKGNLFSYGMIFCDPTPLLVTFLSLFG